MVLSNGAEYGVLMLVQNEEEEFIEEFVFEDFYALNQFITERKSDSLFCENQICFSIVEMINGEADAMSWTKPLEFVELSEDQIKCELAEFEEDLKAHDAWVADFMSQHKQLHYTGESDNYAEKRSRLADYVYVCPHCIRELEECKCEEYPYYLIQIDRKMLPIIRELNTNGFETIACCAGHPEKATATGYMDIYISFAREYDFSVEFPEGGEYSKENHSLRFIVEESECNKLVAKQTEILDKICDWAEMLLPDDMFLDEEF